MQEESIEPSERFLLELGHFLMENERNVPFVMPAPRDPPPQELANTLPPLPQTQTMPSPKSALNQAIKNKNVTAALEQKNRQARLFFSKK